MTFHEHRFTIRYVFAGLLFSIAAPAGALLGRILLYGVAPFEELSEYRFFYLYDLLGTALVFAVAGFVAGRRTDRLRQARDHFQILSEHDELTLLLNSRAFWDHYRRAVERSKRQLEPVTLLLIDVDNLKRLNDEAGHAFGNEALRFVASAVTRSKRGADIAARWGGDEFVVLMPGASSPAGERVAEAILREVRGRPVGHGAKSLPVTVTIGVASMDGEGSRDSLFETADQALYQGKQEGRNRVVVR